MSININNLLEYCSGENESEFARTTIKLSNQNQNRIKTICKENSVITPSKLINYLVDDFLRSCTDEYILDYICELYNINDNISDGKTDITEIISSIIGFIRQYRKNEDLRIQENGVSTLKFILGLFNRFSLISEKDFLASRNYFLGNFGYFESAEEKKIILSFQKDYSLDTMKELLQYIISDAKNLKESKYEFALRNIEVTFRSFVKYRTKDHSALKRDIEIHARNLIKNRPVLFSKNEQLEKDLLLLIQPFSDIVTNVNYDQQTSYDELNAIHLYLGGGTHNFGKVRELIRAHGISRAFSDDELESIYGNLCYLYIKK